MNASVRGNNSGQTLHFTLKQSAKPSVSCDTIMIVKLHIKGGQIFTEEIKLPVIK